ncbi:beta-lactamase family protein [Pseudoalteromonas sp. MMG010]|uniref:serine hydrolase domain-containing protein n=1 Tax=Pseudoalteromonas sp. MMG010 TaxID=2822685 RepID=UPI001B3A5AA8|nr:beta-lactamase family protein [Pseudoalteromonas sp. MMG010]
MYKNILLAAIISVSTCSEAAYKNDFDTILQCYNDNDAPGMVVSLEHSGELIYKGAIGVKNIETMRALTTDDIFQIGSITKTFTAVAILKLAEDKKLSLHDTLGQHLKEINPDYKDLTIDKLLSHTAGLADYLNDPEITQVYDNYAPIDQVIHSITKQPLMAEPGQKYSYSNLGYVLLGHVIEVVTGMSYAQFMAKSFFKPLKMDDTFVLTKGTSAGAVHGYTSNHNAPKTYLNPEKLTQRAWNVDRSWIYSAGAIASTLADMSLWYKALKSGNIISTQSYRLMTTRAKLNNNQPINYGYGVDIYPISGLHSVSHQGQVPGFFAWHVYFPNEDLTATALTNNDTKHPGPALLDMIAVQLNLSPKPVNVQTAKRMAASLIGRYKTPDSTILTISFEHNTLYSQYEGESKRKLIARENNAFSYECTENYFQLRVQNGTTELVPVKLYQGEQKPLLKL